MKKEAMAIKFRVVLNEGVSDQMVYMSEESHDKIPEVDPYHWTKDYDRVAEEYFTAEKIEAMKKELCEKIMASENPFTIYEVDLDGYPVDEEKIWK